MINMPKGCTIFQRPRLVVIRLVVTLFRSWFHIYIYICVSYFHHELWGNDPII